jgi:hypothetical protein
MLITLIAGTWAITHTDLGRQELFFIHFSLSIHFADNFIVAWKRGIAIISAGNVKVTPDPRIRLANGYSLEIRNAAPQDAGDYICQIATLEPREITHTVEILGEFKLNFRLDCNWTRLPAAALSLCTLTFLAISLVKQYFSAFMRYGTSPRRPKQSNSGAPRVRRT